MSSQDTKSYVWALYENHPGLHGKLVGLFSSMTLAKNAALIQPLLQGEWQPREINGSYLWIAPALDSDASPQQSFYFSVEEIQLDRLVQ